jgi:hypothetical protein
MMWAWLSHEPGGSLSLGGRGLKSGPPHSGASALAFLGLAFAGIGY